MKLIVNGQPLEVPEGATVLDLLRCLALGTDAVAVERNGAVVRRARHAETRLEAGDQVEVVTFVGGG
jgi:sulfur carrier protein